MQNILSSWRSVIFIDIIDHNKLTPNKYFKFPLFTVFYYRYHQSHRSTQQTRNSFLTSLSLFTTLSIIVIINFINQRSTQVLDSFTVHFRVLRFCRGDEAVLEKKISPFSREELYSFYRKLDNYPAENLLCRFRVGSYDEKRRSLSSPKIKNKENYRLINLVARIYTHNQPLRRLSLTFVQRDGSRAASLS